MYKLKRKIISLFISLVMLINIPFTGYCNVYAASSVAIDSSLVGGLPLSSLVKYIAIALGIVVGGTTAELNAGSDLVDKELDKIANDLKKGLIDTNDPWVGKLYFKNPDTGKNEKPNKDNKDKWNKNNLFVKVAKLAGVAGVTSGLFTSSGLINHITDDLNNSNAFVMPQQLYPSNEILQISNIANKPWTFENVKNNLNNKNAEYKYDYMNKAILNEYPELKNHDLFYSGSWSVTDLVVSNWTSVLTTINILVPNEKPVYISNGFRNKDYYTVKIRTSNGVTYPCIDQNPIKSIRFYDSDYNEIPYKLYSQCWYGNQNSYMGQSDIYENMSFNFYYGARNQYFVGYGFYNSSNYYGFTDNKYDSKNGTPFNQYKEWVKTDAPVEMPNEKPEELANIGGITEQFTSITTKNDEFPNHEVVTQNTVQTNTDIPDLVWDKLIINIGEEEKPPETETQPSTKPDEPKPTETQPSTEPAPSNDYLQKFVLPDSIKEKFPFCVPFDVAKCLKLFSVTSREAPKWEGVIKYGINGENEYKVSIDLKDFEPIAKIVRPLEFIVFLVGLIIITRDLIKG